MPTLSDVVDALVASHPLDGASLPRLHYWVQALGNREIADITPDEVDEAVVRLADRGRLTQLPGVENVSDGKPLAGATINRYISQLGGVFKHARKLRLLPRSHIPPTKGIEKVAEAPDPDRYFRPEEVERLLTVARVLDKRLGKLTALILVAFHTGLRVGNLMELRRRDLNLNARTATVLKTKNGRPIVAALSERSAEALRRLPEKIPDHLVFAGATGRAYRFRKFWNKVCEQAGLGRRRFHQLRHGCGSAMAKAGVGQATIMAVMGHRTLSASARYMHHSTDDKRRVVDDVFG